MGRRQSKTLRRGSEGVQNLLSRQEPDLKRFEFTSCLIEAFDFFARFKIFAYPQYLRA